MTLMTFYICVFCAAGGLLAGLWLGLLRDRPDMSRLAPTPEVLLTSLARRYHADPTVGARLGQVGKLSGEVENWASIGAYGAAREPRKQRDRLVTGLLGEIAPRYVEVRDDVPPTPPTRTGAA